MKLLFLNTGESVQVSDIDYDELSKYKWCRKKYKHTNYAITICKLSHKNILMHRMIMKLSTSEPMIDHIDHNGLNNQRENLRIANYSQNGINRPLRNGKQYKGVYPQKSKKAWYIICICNGKRYVEATTCKEYAAMRYNELAINYHGEFAVLNILSSAELEIAEKYRKDHPEDTDTYKCCRKCKTLKLKEFFYYHKTNSDHLYSWCKQCTNEKNNKNRKLKQNNGKDKENTNYNSKRNC